MYFEDHHPSHFYAEYQSFKAEYEINTLKSINGKLLNRANALVLEWASIHRDELLMIGIKQEYHLQYLK